MLTSDWRPPERGNVHAHVEARAETGRTLRAVQRSNAHARVNLCLRLVGGARREPYSVAMINSSGPFWPAAHGRKFREFKR